MPVENATRISQLDDRYPLPSDPGSKGDDHLRLIKSVLKKQFPGKDGNGFNTPITLTEEFLNGLPQQLIDMQAALDKRWPVGSILLLLTAQDPNADYPGSWVLVTGDASLALGDGTAANVGTIVGDNTPVVPVPLHGHSASFSGAALPAHSHGIPGTDVEPYGHGSGILDGGRRDRANVNQTDGVSAGTPSGSVTVNNAGTADARLNVRGAQFKVNVWKRTS